eukprot:CAMPEP_0194114710 /NCGR_PEP_ID=MMETSP0150-20130528/21387_1 /TAXON_ID=122233 /ORGANISM="Chaetoceros debilis, Strain MM31A-1" /LENGTH=90 /DNA_ID=CAMNT_0038805009 /DNA_START=34 /DNA_END=306 /DNA_ORIENTATION=+
MKYDIFHLSRCTFNHMTLHVENERLQSTMLVLCEVDRNDVRHHHDIIRVANFLQQEMFKHLRIAIPGYSILKIFRRVHEYSGNFLVYLEQ